MIMTDHWVVLIQGGDWTNRKGGKVADFDDHGVHNS